MICGCERQVAACLLWFQKEHTMRPCVCVCVWIERLVFVRHWLHYMISACMWVHVGVCTRSVRHTCHMVTRRGARRWPRREQRALTFIRRRRRCIELVSWMKLPSSRWIMCLWEWNVSLNQSFLWEHNRHWKEAISAFFMVFTRRQGHAGSQTTQTYISTSAVFFNTSSNRKKATIDTTPETKRTNVGQYDLRHRVFSNGK